MKPAHPPIVQSTTYQFDTIDEMRNAMLSGEPYFYMRSGNPTVQSVAEQLAAMEGGEAALLFSSGMAAVACSLLTLLRSGDHVLCHSEVFSQTRTLLDTLSNKFQIALTYLDFNDPAAVSLSISENTKLFFVETPSNPVLDIVNLTVVGRIAKAKEILLIVDSTLATPILQTPLAYGASLVLHSATKYLSGHADVLGGVVTGSKELVAKIHAVQKLTGGIMDPHAAYLLNRGLNTLPLRMKQICRSASILAKYFSTQPQVRWVRYPFLKSHTRASAARSQMSAGGGVISFELKGGLPAARRFADSLRIIRIATSLGGTESSIEIPYELKRVREDEEHNMGLVRLSVGIEEPSLLKKDIENALKTCSSL